MPPNIATHVADTLRTLRSLDRDQKNAFAASFLGWALDAFDYFLLVFVLSDVAHSFGVKDSAVAYAITLTLAMRPVGAVVFGWAADKYGRRGPLMLVVVFYSLIELLTGFAPTLTTFLVLRALFGIGMGGEWGVGASLAMESVPEEARGVLSGVLQEGYAVGYLLAAVAYAFVYPHLGWRTMFFVGAVPALLSVFIRMRVKESPVWQKTKRERVDWGAAIAAHGKLFLYLILLMTAFNFMSHGTQDLYPTFLKKQHHFKPNAVSLIAVTYNIGALMGGVFFGTLSQRFGRRKAIVTAALLALPLIPIWAFSQTAGMLALGAFLIQFMVQGAWGVIPAHLTELSPSAFRGIVPGLAYQFGNLCASLNGPLQTKIAEREGGNYGLALAMVIVVVLCAVAVVTWLGPERRAAKFESAP